VTETDLEQIKNHISNIPHVAVMYVPGLIAAVESLLSERKDLRDKLITVHSEVDKLRADRRQLRRRLVECRPWVGVCPFPNQPGFGEMLAIRDLADDTLAEVKE